MTDPTNPAPGDPAPTPAPDLNHPNLVDSITPIQLASSPFGPSETGATILAMLLLITRGDEARAASLDRITHEVYEAHNPIRARHWLATITGDAKTKRADCLMLSVMIAFAAIGQTEGEAERVLLVGAMLNYLGSLVGQQSEGTQFFQEPSGEAA